MIVEDYHAEYQEINMFTFRISIIEIKGLMILLSSNGRKQQTKIFYQIAICIKCPCDSHDWTLRDVYVKDFNDNYIDIRHLKFLDTTFSFTISEMAHRESAASSMSFNELRYSFIKREKEKGSSMVPMYEIELHRKTSYPFAAYILTLIGVSVASQKRRGGVGVNIAIGLGIVFVYILQ